MTCVHILLDMRSREYMQSPLTLNLIKTVEHENSFEYKTAERQCTKIYNYWTALVYIPKNCWLQCRDYCDLANDSCLHRFHNHSTSHVPLHTHSLLTQTYKLFQTGQIFRNWNAVLLCVRPFILNFIFALCVYLVRYWIPTHRIS